jgi:hypothetical protein
MNFSDLRKKIEENGITYKDYINRNIEEIAGTQTRDLSSEEIKKFNFKTLNLQRGNRISRTYEPGNELRNLLAEISEPRLWMVITESWCGDSAQNLPYIAAMASLNPLIDLKILSRDSNPDIMDEFLTNGTRSIPILAAFNSAGDELFRWGPRPKAAVDLIKQWKSEGLEKSEWVEKLHLWYARNKGAEIEKEFIDLIEKEVIAH